MKERSERQSSFIALIRLALPAVLQQLMGTLLQYVDTAMVGHLGEAATAAVSTSTTVNWLVHSIPYGMSVGLLSTLSQAAGRNDRTEMKRLAAMGSRLSLWMGLALTAVCLGVSPFLPTWMQAAEAIRQPASAYFFVVSLALPFSVTSGMFASAMHAVKDTRTPMIINLSANALNVVLNYLLIYRASLGVMGAAYATAISTTLCGIVMFLVFRRKKALRFGRADYFRIDLKAIDIGREGKWNFSWTIINLTDHDNMFFTFYDTRKNPPKKTSISQFPFLPIMLNYEYYF